MLGHFGGETVRLFPVLRETATRQDDVRGAQQLCSLRGGSLGERIQCMRPRLGQVGRGPNPKDLLQRFGSLH